MSYLNILPKGWEDVSVSEYIDIIKIDMNENLSGFSKTLEKLCLLSDSDIWEDLEYDELSLTLSQIPWIYNNPVGKDIKNISNYHLIDFNKLKLGEWIDIDGYIIDIINKIPNLLSVIWRRVDSDKWGNVEIEPYSFNKVDRCDIMLSMSISDIWKSVVEIKEFRENILGGYSEIFTSSDFDWEPDEDDEKYLSLDEIDSIKRDMIKEKEDSQFSWFYLVDTLTGGDITKTEAVLDLPVLYVFNYLLMRLRQNNKNK